MISNEDSAKEYAKYYFRLIAKEAGINWNSDNDMEIDLLIEAIIAAAKEATLIIVRREAAGE